MVYLISCKITNTCKIGFANRPVLRLAELQTGNPYELDLTYIMEGDFHLEKELHTKFDKYRLKGEWFSADPEIIEYFEANCIKDKKTLEKIKKHPRIPAVAINENYKYYYLMVQYDLEIQYQIIMYYKQVLVSFPEFPSLSELRKEAVRQVTKSLSEESLTHFYREIEKSMLITGMMEIPYDKVAKWIN